MEFFKIIDKKVTEKYIQEKINPETIQNFTESMQFIEADGQNFKGLTLWGEFIISYDKIKGGVRFTLVDCPNALSWTITTGYPPKRDMVILHCVINRTQKPEEFLEEMEEFMEEWITGIKVTL